MDAEGGIVTHFGSQRSSDRGARRVAVFLTVSYAVAAPVVAVLEYRGALLSQRFDVPPELIYLTAVVQLVSVAGIVMNRFARTAAAALSVITLGAVAAHLRIGSPLTAIPAIVYTLLQIWFGISSHRLQKK